MRMAMEKVPMYQTIVFLWSMFIVQVCSQFFKFVKLLNDDLSFVEYIGLYKSLTGIVCITLCSKVNNCSYAGFDERYGLCFLHDLNATSVKGTGRTYYIKVGDTSGAMNLNMDLKTGATAWQSSTYSYGSTSYVAQLALDGNSDPDFLLGGSCAATSPHNYTYWAMKFGMAGVVSSVDIYLRSDHVVRNTNRSVLISQTKDDADKHIGTMCGGYFGPIITATPFKIEIQCPRPIYGRFLRITYEAWDAMEICEVGIHTL